MAKSLIGKKNAKEDEQERADIIKLICAVGRKAAYADIYTALSGFPTKRTELALTLERLMNAMRDLIVTKKADAKTVFFTSSQDSVKQCGDISTARLVAVYDAVKSAHELCARNANVQNIVATLASNIRLAAGK